MENQGQTGFEIAVIGMAGRFPGARDLGAFWDNLVAGKECITFFSEEEVEKAGVPVELRGHPNYVRARGMLAGVDLFDANFFGYSPQEACVMDPQQRIFLETCWHAMEDAGYDPARHKGKIGVFAGVGFNSYLMLNVEMDPRFIHSERGPQAMLGNDKDFAATRVSYKLDLKGPSVVVQSACSTSLVAIHQACQGLWSGECDMQIAGGVSIRVPQETGHLFQEGMIVSPDGHCRAFDAQAAGTVAGNGSAAVVLKRLADAVRDRDHVYAVIKGVAINNDGTDKVGYSAPSVAGEAEVITTAQALGGVSPETVGFVEAHGSGTRMGDPIEMEALRKAFGAAAGKTGFCAVGSVKSSIGHLDAAAGVAGFVKAALAVDRALIPPSVNFASPNPLCAFEGSPFFVNAEPLPWNPSGHPRRAGVSSFGMGGTNAHAVLEQAPPRPASGPSRPQQLVLLSAKTLTALGAVAAGLSRALAASPEPLADTAFTLAVGRQPFNHRRFCLARDNAEAAALLAAPPEASTSHHCDNITRLMTFAFSGQGSQHAGMARGLYEREAGFRTDLDRCLAVLRDRAGLDLRPILFPDAGGSQEAIHDTRHTQPALFCVEWCLARHVMRLGILPQALIGHSVGEYVAACLAGVFTLEDALAVVVRRGALLQALPRGAMLHVAAAEEDVARFASGPVGIATSNSPLSTVFSGPEERIAELESRLATEGVQAQRVKTSHAFHSAMMEPALEPFAAFLRGISLRPPTIPIVSNVTGDYLTDAEAVDPLYWARHLRGTVRFRAGIERLLNGPYRTFLEVGPGHVLTQCVRQIVGPESHHLAFPSMRHPKSQADDQGVLLKTLGQLWAQGHEPDWHAYFASEARNRLSLPGYPFEGRRFWVEAPAAQIRRAEPAAGGGLFVPVWTQDPVPAARSTESGVLVFTTDGARDKAVLQGLRALGRVVTVLPGKAFMPPAAGVARIRPGMATDYRGLLRGLGETGGIPSTVVFLWTLPGSPLTPRTGPDADAMGALSALVEALAEAAPGAGTLLLVAGESAADVLDGDAVSPMAAVLPALCAMLSASHEGLVVRHCDLEMRPWPGRGRREAARDLLREALAVGPSGSLAFRRGRRWRRGWASVAHAVPGPCLRQGGTYLLLDAFHPAAADLAASLGRERGALAVIAGDRDLPPRAEWEALASQAAKAQSARGLGAFLGKLLAMEKEGLPFRLLRVDAGSEAALLEAAGRAASERGSLDGTFAFGFPDIVWEEGREFLWNPAQTVDHLKHRWARLQALDALHRSYPALPAVLICSAASLSPAFRDPAVALADALAAAHLAKLGSPLRRLLLANPERFPGGTGEVGGRPLLASLEAALLRGESAETADTDVHPDRLIPPAPPFAAAESGPGKALHARPDLGVPYAAPITDRQKSICRIWSEMFAVDKVGIHDNFFDLGGDSVMALKLVALLEERFRVQLPLAEVLQAPTVAEQANSVVEYSQVRLDERPVDPLVRIQTAGDKPPFFCVHPAGGIIHCYVELSRLLGKDQPFHAFQHPGIDGRSGPYVTYPKMAELYIEAMRKVQPKGPYFIGGWSFGGTVAYEMAVQLAAMGETVAMLALFDSPGPSSLYSVKQRPEFEFAGMLAFLSQALATMFGAEIKVSVEEMRKLKREDQLDYVLSRTSAQSGNASLENSREALERIIDIFEVCDVGERDYRPAPFRGLVNMYRVTKLDDYEFTGYRDHPQLKSPTFGWDQLVQGSVDSKPVAGSHISMVFRPDVEVLARTFKADLDKRIEEFAGIPSAALVGAV